MTTSAKDKIRKLLIQAADQEGTPEGDAFQSKAMELLARYGLTDFDVRPDHEDGEEMICRDQETPKYYVRENQVLLRSIGSALGVYVVRYSGRNMVKVAGTRKNLERVDMLFTLLSNQMLAGSKRLSAKMGERFTTQQLRRSYCHAYATRIFERLSQIESKVREEVRAEGVVVPVNEFVQARLFFNQAAPGVRVQAGRSAARASHAAMDHGRADANRADLGQSRVRGQRALA